LYWSPTAEKSRASLYSSLFRSQRFPRKKKRSSNVAALRCGAKSGESAIDALSQVQIVFKSHDGTTPN
jgi:hypothetical protein